MYPAPGYRIFRAMGQTAAQSLFHMRIIGREKLIQDGPSLVVANHQSFLDPPLIGQLFETGVYFLARHNLWHNRILGFMLNQCDVTPLNQTRPDPSSMTKLIKIAKAGGRIGLFPEGARTPDGKIHEAMPGIGLLLSRLGDIPIQPIRIEGAYDCLPIHSNRLRLKPITLAIGDPFTLDYKSFSGKSRRDIQRAVGVQVMSAISALSTEY
ncbi:MAG: lysophospholipid acyltransferase family protein [Akkermansia sp.]